MADFPKDQGLSLMQAHPAKNALLEKMRSKLASTPPPAMEAQSRKREVRRKSAVAWSIRGALVLAFVGANFLLIGNKNVIIARIGLEAVPSLPGPDRALSADDQALYWTYALYDFAKLRQRFGVQGYLAINPAVARRNLEDLLPEVSQATLGKISAYGPVAFKTVGPAKAWNASGREE